MWKRFKRQPTAYDVQRLLDNRELEGYDEEARVHIVCDIDKTYLETEFGSFVEMARIAFQGAEDKVTVKGATEALLAARWGFRGGDVLDTSYPRFLHFVSSSPPQLRSVLEEKLKLDGLDWSTDTFKNQAYNIRKGRMDLLRRHVDYKSLAILQLMKKAGDGAKFSLIGDNAETDSYIYVGIKFFVQNQLSHDGYRRYLEIGGAEEDAAADVIEEFSEIPKVDVRTILIRNAPGYTSVKYSPMTDPVRPFDNFFDASFALWLERELDPESLWSISRKFHNSYGISLEYLRIQLLKWRHSDILTDEMNKALEETLARIGEDTKEEVVSEQPLNLEHFNSLKEEEILKYAGIWIDKIRSRST